MHKDSLSNAFDNALSGKEHVKNLAFFGLLHSMQKAFQTTGLVVRAGDKVPAQFLKHASQITIEAAAITGLSAGTEVVFGEKFHPTWEEFFQAMLMSLLFRAPQLLKETKSTSTSTNVEATPGYSGGTFDVKQSRKTLVKE